MDNLYHMADLVDGSQASDCPLPCKTTQTQTRFLHESVTPNNTWIDISFSSKVKVTTTDMLRPKFTNILSDVI